MAPPRKPHALRARLDLRLPVELLEQLQAVADRHGVELAVVARTALRRGIGAADEQLDREIAEHREGRGDTQDPR